MNSETSRKTRQIDMLHGSILQKLILVAIPIALSSILQQLFNAADVAVVGRYASSDAMAAVGSNASIINMVVTLFTGLSVGSNVMISAFIGADRKDQVNDALHTSFAVALLSGFIMLIIGQFITKPALMLLGTPENVLDQAILYLRIYFLAMPFIMVYDFGSAVLRSVGDTRRPLYCLIFAGLLNVVLNLFFVCVLDRGADGVAIATVISNAVSAFLVFRMLRRETGMLHLDLRKLSIRGAYLRKILVIGGPTGLQGMIFSFSNAVIQTAINSFGSACIAGNSAALYSEYICYFVVYGFAQAAVTFVSQNYAAGSYDRCRRVVRTAFLCAVCFTSLVSVPFFFARHAFMSFFSSDPEVIYYGMIRMAWITALEPVTAYYEIPGSALRGLNRSVTPALLTLLGCCGLRFIYITLFLHSFTAFSQVVRIYLITWTVTGTAMFIAYFRITGKLFQERSLRQ